MNTTDKTFEQAVQLHQRGDFQRAESLYLAVLTEIPAHDQALHLMGVAAMQGGRKEEAKRWIEKSIASNPVNPAVLSNMGNCCRELGTPAEAVIYYDRALELDSRYCEAHYNRGNALRDLGDLEGALAGYQQALVLQPRFVAALVNRGNALHRLGRLPQALESYDAALREQPTLAEAHLNRGRTLLSLRRYGEAVHSFDQALRAGVSAAGVWSDRAAALLGLCRYADALGACERALAADPADVIAHHIRGRIYGELNRLDESIACFREALKISPDFHTARCDLGDALLRLEEPDQAMAEFERVLVRDPQYASALNGKGNVLEAARDFAEALACYDEALELDGQNPAIWSNRSTVLLSLGRHPEALEAADEALKRNPEFAHAHNARGLALLRSQGGEAAIPDFELALRLAPNFTKARINYANALLYSNRNEDAYDAFNRLLAVAPKTPRAPGFRMHAQARICEWTDYQERASALMREVQSGTFSDHPFGFLSVCDSPHAQRQCAETYVRDYVPRPPGLWKEAFYRHERVRIGYLSSDLRDHPVSYLLAGLFEAHDRERFEVMALSSTAPAEGDFTRRVQGAFDRFIDIRGRSEREIAADVRALEIDVLVDLTGHTAGSRCGLFAERLAPVQVNYVGFPGTMGAPWMDYIIGDAFLIPEETAGEYSEAIAYLPECFQGNDDKRRRGDVPARSELKLPESAVVLCSFNNTHKINPTIFDVWMRLLARCPDTVLWLAAPEAVVEANLRREAKMRGVDPERIIFASRVAYPQHLARLPAADLALDTLPFGAGATASDALFAGVPLLTCVGKSYAARMGGSLLNSLNMPDLITSTLNDYEARALDLASDREALRRVRQRLADNARTSALFNTARFTRHLEQAFLTMLRRAEAGLAPATFHVERAPP